MSDFPAGGCIHRIKGDTVLGHPREGAGGGNRACGEVDRGGERDGRRGNGDVQGQGAGALGVGRPDGHRTVAGNGGSSRDPAGGRVEGESGGKSAREAVSGGRVGGGDLIGKRGADLARGAACAGDARQLGGRNSVDRAGEGVGADGSVTGVAVGEDVAFSSARHAEVIGAGGEVGGDRGGKRIHRVAGSLDNPSGVEQFEFDVEVGGGRGRVGRSRERAARGLKPEHVGVGGRGNQTALVDGVVGEGQGRRRGRGVAGLVGQITDPISRLGDDGQIVLPVTRVGVLALAPLDELTIVPHPHDGRPAGRACTCTCVVFLARVGTAIMIQAERVADFVGNGFGNPHHSRVEYPAWNRGAENASGPRERIHVGYPARARCRRVIRSHNAAGPAVGRHRIVAGQICGDVHIERRVILLYPVEDLRHLRRSECHGRRHNAAAPVPARVGDRFTVEIQVDYGRCVGPAGKQGGRLSRTGHRSHL